MSVNSANGTKASAVLLFMCCLLCEVIIDNGVDVRGGGGRGAQLRIDSQCAAAQLVLAKRELLSALSVAAAVANFRMKRTEKSADDVIALC
ncbi:unnamed protein product [Nippostrongylus brasiliensis]|uniref:Secreted protein n=1 Tax=Nippostrongylus brasiliensis TaxID=27835 RepID=A0A0N4XTL7_NIPBR|nr:unnamed protein product [Nippostrongylus brasiliensis]